MVAFIFILILSFASLLTYKILEKRKALNRNTKTVLLIVVTFILFLFFSQMCYTDSKNLGSGFVYNSGHKHIIGKIDIPPTIISYNYDKNFIIVEQRPKKMNEAIYDKMEYVYPVGRDTVYFWIIIKQEQNVLGPLSRDSLQLLKQKHNIPDKLLKHIIQ